MGKLEEVTREIVKKHNPWVPERVVDQVVKDFEYYTFVDVYNNGEPVFMLYSDKCARETGRIIPCTVCGVDVFMDEPTDTTPDYHTCEDVACIDHYQKQMGGAN